MLLTVCCQKENFPILISAQMLYLHMLRKEMKIEHCGEHIGLLFYNRQIIGQINIGISIGLFPPPQIKYSY